MLKSLQINTKESEEKGTLLVGMYINMWSLKHKMNLCMKQKQFHESREQTHGCQGGEVWGRDRVGGLDLQM